MKKTFKKIITISAVLLLLFQVGHFMEHLVQFGFWLLSSKDSMFMSSWATSLVEGLASLFSEKDPMSARLLGIELLHLTGNSIFMVGLLLLRAVHKSKALKIATISQGIHLLEHIILTTTILTFGTPLGFTTLWGAESSVVFLIGWRVVWHLVLNLVPSIYGAIAVSEFFGKKKN